MADQVGDNNEENWEPVWIMKKEDLWTQVKYAHDNKLRNTTGWKWGKRSKKFINKVCITHHQSTCLTSSEEQSEKQVQVWGSSY